ncbi:hypothetical protein [Mycolicibacterium sp. J2]|uniref:hypothetical protein n=1 Tax=Mycolicibacterium sp. J2 TaxID=2993511 RepID=UPI00224B6171|nr:hypothetical protein [Mycolicibacterium sp. J2]MCX2713130.1 hypothetical protein [Mycolicibacterium sp. J2]
MLLTVVLMVLAGCSVEQRATAQEPPLATSGLGGYGDPAVAGGLNRSGEVEDLVGEGRPFWHAENDAFGAGARIASVPAAAGFPALIPGVKIRGGNIVVKPDGASWGGLFSEWDWNDWIRPQVDRARALGMNTVRLIGNPGIIFLPAGENYPAITEEQYIARWRQLAAYTQSLGMMLYPALCEKWAFWDGTKFDYTDPQRIAAVTAVAKALAEYPNVIGFDVFQEGSGKDDGLTVSNVLDLYGAIRSVAPNVPLTTSNSSDGFGNPEDFWDDQSSIPYQAWTAGGGADFLDIHVYLENVDVTRLANFTRLGKPILVGEFGTPQSLAPAQQEARIASGKDLHNLPGVLGSIVWGLADQGTTDADRVGIWDNTGFVPDVSPLSVSTGQRTSLTDLLREFH